MKTILALIIMTAMSLSGTAAPPESAQSQRQHRIVFEFVSDNPKQHESVLNNVENALKAFEGKAQIFVISHGPGLSLLHQPEKASLERMEKLSQGKRVTFAACENTMKRKGVPKADLVPFATTVDSGVAEVVRKQESGWSYIKSGG